MGGFSTAFPQPSFARPMRHLESQPALWPDSEIGAYQNKRIPMGAFGERMQREREMRGISLEEIAESTKIGARMLRALEEEDFEKLPGGIFNKGFVRAYSKYLGLDEEQAVADFMAAITEKQRKKTEANVAAGVEVPSSRPDRISNIYQAAALTSVEDAGPDFSRGLRLAVIVLVLLAAFAGLGWLIWNRLHLSETVPPQKNVAPAKSVAAPPAVPNQVQAASTNPAPKDTATGTVNPSAPSSAIVLNGALVSTGTTSPQAAAPTGRFTVRLEARQLSWVNVRVDGKNLSEELLQPHTSREFTAEKDLVVKLGNAAGVNVSFNGKPVPPPSPDAKTLTLSFGPSGIVQ